MAWALQSDGVNDHVDGDLVTTMSGDFILKYEGQISSNPANTVFYNLLAIYDKSGNDYLGVAVRGMAGGAVAKIISNASTPGEGSTQIPINTDLVLEVRYTSSTNTAEFFINGTPEYTVNPSGGATWIPLLDGYRMFSATGSTTFGHALLKDNTSIIDSVTSANTLIFTPTNSGGTGLILDESTANNENGVLMNFPGDNSQWVLVGGGGISITPNTINSASVSNNPVIAFNSVLNLTPNAINSLSIANNPSIQFNSVVNISPATIDSASVSNDPIVSFSAVLNITPQAIDSASLSNNPTIVFNNPLNIAPSSIDSLSVSNNPVIEFKSIINVLPQAIDSLSVSINPFISFGVVQTIGNVTASFKDSGISVKYEEDKITVNFK